MARVKVTIGEMPINHEAVGNSWFPDVYLQIDSENGPVKLVMSGTEADAIGRSLCDHARYSCSEPIDNHKHKDQTTVDLGEEE